MNQGGGNLRSFTPIINRAMILLSPIIFYLLAARNTEVLLPLLWRLIVQETRQMHTISWRMRGIHHLEIQVLVLAPNLMTTRVKPRGRIANRCTANIGAIVELNHLLASGTPNLIPMIGRVIRATICSASTGSRRFGILRNGRRIILIDFHRNKGFGFRFVFHNSLVLKQHVMREKRWRRWLSVIYVYIKGLFILFYHIIHNFYRYINEFWFWNYAPHRFYRG